MKERIITALIAGAIFITTLIYGQHWIVDGLLLFIGLVSAAEWANLLALPQPKKGFFIFLVGALTLAALQVPLLAKTLIALVATGWLCTVPWLLYKYERGQTLQITDKHIAGTGIASLAAFVAAVDLVYGHLGSWGTLALFLIIWVSDSVAYFVGRKWGKTPLAPHVSPKKTREGLLGGVGSALLLALLFLLFFDLPGSKALFLVLSVLAVFYGVLGDLWESVLKRRAGLKDSGRILPGHGGMLDRIDSWLSAFPIWALAFL